LAEVQGGGEVELHGGRCGKGERRKTGPVMHACGSEGKCVFRPKSVANTQSAGGMP
jgi:hypothetical protein